MSCCGVSTLFLFFFFSSRRRHTRLQGDWSSDVCSSDLWRRFFLRRPFGLPTSQGRGGLGSMDSTLALGAFRIARDAGGEAVREREPRRAGEGRCLELNSCVLIDYRLWAAKSEGRHGSSSASSSASSIPLNLGVGCAPSCWPIFGFRNLLGARRGAEGSFLCSLITSFFAEGAGGGGPPRRWRG